jgi:thiamine biosynthesis protein ThiS
MIVTVNGEERSLPAESTIASLVEGLSAPSRGVAVEWQATGLRDGARIEVVAAIQGGSV